MAAYKYDLPPGWVRQSSVFPLKIDQKKYNGNTNINLNRTIICTIQKEKEGHNLLKNQNK